MTEPKTSPVPHTLPPEPPNMSERASSDYAHAPIPPLPNYSLSSVCPACGNATFKLACKVRCGRCGFMWDCSEL